MNQILSTQDINNRNKSSKKSRSSSGTKDINSVIKFFAIGIFIFGVFLIINSSYAMLKGNGKETGESVGGKPTIEIENKGEDKILLVVMHEDDIEKIRYSWNQENPITENITGKFYQKEIAIPNGKNTLYVTATDVNGNITNMQKTFELNLTTAIDILISGNNIKVNLKGKDEITEFKYAWDEEEPTTVKVNDTEYSMELEAPIGRHKLNVTAININGEEEQKSQDVVGTTKPTIKIKKGNNAYKITVHDDIGLDRIVITKLENGKETTVQADGKDFEYDYPVYSGSDNFIEIKAYNDNGVQSKRVRAKWPKK